MNPNYYFFPEIKKKRYEFFRVIIFILFGGKKFFYFKIENFKKLDVSIKIKKNWIYFLKI